MFRLFYSLQVLMEKRIPSFMPGMTSSVVHSTGSPDNFDIQQNLRPGGCIKVGLSQAQFKILTKIVYQQQHQPKIFKKQKISCFSSIFVSVHHV